METNTEFISPIEYWQKLASIEVNANCKQVSCRKEQCLRAITEQEQSKE